MTGSKNKSGFFTDTDMQMMCGITQNRYISDINV